MMMMKALNSLNMLDVPECTLERSITDKSTAAVYSSFVFSAQYFPIRRSFFLHFNFSCDVTFKFFFRYTFLHEPLHEILMVVHVLLETQKILGCSRR